jgi:dTMP kinase
MSNLKNFITIEGIEGAGKTTVLNILKKKFDLLNQRYVLTREPGGTNTGESIRNILLHNKDKLQINTELLLVVAARLEHLESVIKPAISSGKLVLCDRYIDSTYAYQGAGRGIPYEKIDLIHEVFLNNYLPSKTILCDVSLKTSRERVIKRGNNTDNFEKLGDDFFLRARECFLNRAKNEPDRFIVIDTSLPLIEIEENIDRLNFSI